MSDDNEVTYANDVSSQDASDGFHGGEVDLDQFIEVDGEQYPRTKVREAFEALNNRDKWETDFKNRDKAFAKVRQIIEVAFGKPYLQLSNEDLRDLQGFAVLNSKIRDDPAFAKAWEATLVEMYQGRGLTKREAMAAAKEDVKDAKAAAETGEGKPVSELPDDVRERLRKIDEIEARERVREAAALRDYVQSTVDAEIKSQASDLLTYGGFLAKQVYYELLGYDDGELMQLARSGHLAQMIAGLTKEAAERVRKEIGERGKQHALAIKSSTKAAPGPFKGGALSGKAKEEYVPRRGRGLSALHERARSGLATLQDAASD